MQTIMKLLTLSLLVAGTTAFATDLSIYEEFAASADQAAWNRDWAFFTTHADTERLWEKVIVDFREPKGDAAGFAMGMKSSLDGKAFGGVLESSVGEWDSFDYMRIRIRDDQPHMLFRLNTENGLNYHEYRLGEDGNGEVVIEDVYVYTMGEYLSETFRSNYNSGVMAFDGWKSWFSGKRGDLKEKGSKMLDAQALIREGRFSEAQPLLADLVDDEGMGKLACLLSITCGSNIDEQSYLEAMERFGEKFPGDPAWLLLSLDYYFLMGRYEETFEGVRKLDEIVGGDPALKVLEAGYRLEMGEIDQARAMVLEVSEESPEMEDAWWTLVTIDLMRGDHEAVVNELDYLVENYGYYFSRDDLAGEELYADFLASDVGRTWMAEHEAEE